MTQAPTDEPAPGGLIAEFKRHRERERQQAEAMLSLLCSQLAEDGIDRVVIGYDGCSDSGCLEDIRAYAGDTERFGV